MRGELAGRGRAHANAAAELDLRADGDPDERRDGRVRVPLAEERRLELGVRAVERLVVPVEAAARFGGGHQQRQDDRAEERVLFIRALTGVRAGEDPRGRLAAQVVHGQSRVLADRERGGARLEEGADERAVLVERGPSERRVLLEGEREVGAALELRAEHAERSEAEATEGAM